MNVRAYLVLASLLSVSAASWAQDAGGLPQQVQWGMQQAMRDLEAKSLGITEESMKEEVGEEAMQGFLDGAVVRLVLSPDGSYSAYTLEGGELVSFKLGKQSVELTGLHPDIFMVNLVIINRPDRLSPAVSCHRRKATPMKPITTL